MKVHSVQLVNVKSFADSGVLDLSPGINLLVGHNNSGKSAIIRALHNMQAGGELSEQAIRLRATEGSIRIGLSDLQTDYLVPSIKVKQFQDAGEDRTMIRNSMIRQSPERSFFALAGQDYRFERFPALEPANFIYPYLSKRKVAQYSETVNNATMNGVEVNLSLLPAKVARLNNPNNSAYARYRKVCGDILGFQVSALPTTNGQGAGLHITDHESVHLQDMGEGVSNLLGLITALCKAENRLFLIEEIENDIHPLALRKLLDLIIESSATNQFVISTHSNIVALHLGAQAGAKVFGVTLDAKEAIPTSSCVEIGDDPQERYGLLEELGYEPTDAGIWKAWLILEESSAERIINDLLIPGFAPKLRSVRTVSAGGVDGVPPRFEDFNRLVIFTHLEPVYRNKTWVIVDGDAKGKKVVEDLKAKYGSSGWDTSRFHALGHTDFELYYPPQFAAKASAALALTDKAKRTAKNDLLNEVLDWSLANPGEAKAAFAASAADVISVLQGIENALYPAS